MNYNYKKGGDKLTLLNDVTLENPYWLFPSQWLNDPEWWPSL